MRRHAGIWTLVLGLTTAVGASASAGRHDTTFGLTVRPSVGVFLQPVQVTVTGLPPGPRNTKLQFQECGVYPARPRDALQVVFPGGPGGNWSGPVTLLANGTLRATERSIVSNEVRFTARAHVLLAATRPGHYRTYVDGRLSFWRKRVRIERLDGNGWVPLRTVVLDRTEPSTINTQGEQQYGYIRSRSAEFALKVPGGTKLRAVFPLSQAKPCYAAGTSEVVQT